jgi:four helix bundle protein
MKSYRDLEIFNLSYRLALKAHEMSMSLPKYELYEEGGQLRRSTKGITANIGEGYGRRKYKAEFIKFLIYAHSSCDESIIHLNFIMDTHKEMEGEVKPLVDYYDVLGGKINRYIQYVETEWR